jgi:hypothetical protein
LDRSKTQHESSSLNLRGEGLEPDKLTPLIRLRKGQVSIDSRPPQSLL